MYMLKYNTFNAIRPGWVPGSGGVRKVPAAFNSKTIHGIEMRFGRVVDNHKLIHLV